MRIPIVCATLSLLTLGCNKSDTGTPPVTVTPPAAVATVTVAPTSTALVPLQTLQFTATTADAAGNVLSGRAVTWASSAASVATVSASGLVTAVAVGAAAITATSEGKSANVAITVGDGAFVGAAGATVTAQGGKVVIIIPPGALSAATAITVDTATPRSSPSLVAGSSYTFGPDGIRFAMPVTLRIKYDPAKVLAGFSQRDIRLLTGSRDTSVQISGTIVDSIAHTVEGKTTHFSIFRLDVGRFKKLDDDAVLPGRYLIQGQEITLCVGTPQEVAPDIADPDLRAGTMSVRAGFPEFATVGGNINGNADGIEPTIINPLSRGTALIEFVINAPPKKAIVQLLVRVEDKFPPCGQPNFAAILHSGTTDNVVLYGPNGITPVTTDGVSTSPALGIGGGLNGPLAFLQGTAALKIFWNGSAGGDGTAIIASPGVSFQGFTFTDPTTLVFAQQLSSGSATVDLFRVKKTGETVPIRITNLRGFVTNPAAANDGSVYFSFSASPTAAAHIYKITAPAGSNPVPVTTPIPVTTGTSAELQPAVSQNSNFLAFSRLDPGLASAQILSIDLSKPNALPVKVSPDVGFAFSPTSCGNWSWLYSYSTNLNGPYTVFRYDVFTGVRSPITGLTGGSFGQIAVAPTTGDGGLHVCPK